MAELHVQRKRNRYLWLWVVILVLIILGGIYYYMHNRNLNDYPQERPTGSIVIPSGYSLI